MSVWEPPAWTDDKGTTWVWDSATQSYAPGDPNSFKYRVDRSHATGGDNDLFSPNQIEHREQTRNPLQEGWAGSDTSGTYLGKTAGQIWIADVSDEDGHSIIGSGSWDDCRQAILDDLDPKEHIGVFDALIQNLQSAPPEQEWWWSQDVTQGWIVTWWIQHGAGDADETETHIVGEPSRDMHADGWVKTQRTAGDVYEVGGNLVGNLSFLIGPQGVWVGKPGMHHTDIWKQETGEQIYDNEEGDWIVNWEDHPYMDTAQGNLGFEIDPRTKKILAIDTPKEGEYFDLHVDDQVIKEEAVRVIQQWIDEGMPDNSYPEGKISAVEQDVFILARELMARAYQNGIADSNEIIQFVTENLIKEGHEKYEEAFKIAFQTVTEFAKNFQGIPQSDFDDSNPYLLPLDEQDFPDAHHVTDRITQSPIMPNDPYLSSAEQGFRSGDQIALISPDEPEGLMGEIVDEITMPKGQEMLYRVKLQDGTIRITHPSWLKHIQTNTPSLDELNDWPTISHISNIPPNWDLLTSYIDNAARGAAKIGNGLVGVGAEPISFEIAEEEVRYLLQIYDKTLVLEDQVLLALTQFYVDAWNETVSPDGGDSGLVAPEGWTSSVTNMVKCPNCQEDTDTDVCPGCGKSLTPEWNNQDSNDIMFDPAPQHPQGGQNEFYSDPVRVPRRNIQKTDDSYPSMISKQLSHETPNLDDCPQCHDVLVEQNGEKICAGCGNKQPIISQPIPKELVMTHLRAQAKRILEAR